MPQALTALHAYPAQGKKHHQQERLRRLGPEVAAAATPWRPQPNPELLARSSAQRAALARRVLTRRGRWLRPQGPGCALCRKQFTSEAQLEEHKRGKWHQMRLRGDPLPAKGRA